MQVIPRAAEAVKGYDPHTLSHIDPTHRIRRLNGTVVQLQEPARGIVRVRVAVDGRPLMFAPGQYAHVSIEGSPECAHAMANRPGDPLLEFHVKGVAGELREGARVRLHGPHGTALWRKPFGEPMLLVAFDSGFAPIKSLLLWALAEAADDIGPVHVYHGAQEACDLHDGDIIANAGGGIVHYVPVASEPSVERLCRHGSLAQAIESDFPSLAGFRVYLAGPRAVVEECTAAAVRLGARHDDVHADDLADASRTPIAAQEPPRRGLLRAIFG
ncbi:MAG TPA: hypothetical protein VFP36_10810 [Usitatibacter sp.]|nr:hypothetical protein [Usitatibacter sp.]